MCRRNYGVSGWVLATTPEALAKNGPQHPPAISECMQVADSMDSLCSKLEI